jgi:hypothetical protein
VRNAPSKYNFKAGDKVICINNASEDSLEVGKVYTCTQTKAMASHWVSILELHSEVFYANRFIPYTELNKELA